MKRMVKFYVTSELRGLRKLFFLLPFLLYFLFSVARIATIALIVLILPIEALAESPAQVDRLTQQWLDTERQASHLQSEWKTQQPLLTQRLALLNAEKQQLQALLKQRGVSKNDVDSRRAELLAEQSQLEQQQTELSRALILLTSRLQNIAVMLPPALSTAWQKEQGTLSDDVEISQQLHVALAQLTSLADFDKRVSVHEGTITSVEGQTILVEQLYLGVGVAWFTSRDKQQVGWGQADENGWHWHFDESVSASEVSKAISMFQKRKTAELVHLPIRLVTQGYAEIIQLGEDVSSLNGFEYMEKISRGGEGQP